MQDSARFAKLCHEQGVANDTASRAWIGLHTRYSEPHRHYHNLHHIAAMLAKMDEVAPGDPATELAIWFHDVIYDPRARDNEEQSAAFFVAEMADSLDPVLCLDVVRLILATDYARERTGAADENLLRDIDLAILASAPETYQSYSDAVRKEYAHVPDGDFRKGRAAVMSRFLDGRIFHTDAFANEELIAKGNIRNEIARLTD
ncbi:MAG: phosphohydrolase [Verrucomicrobiaceae bacterium]|nr:MAG: phosphohydrolase [Verrucomicrobiaceae bacterium]